MARNKPAGKRPLQKQRSAKPKDSILKEAWDNMSEDFNRFMPERLQKTGKKKFVFWLFVLEVIVLGVIGTFLYDWLFR